MFRDTVKGRFEPKLNDTKSAHSASIGVGSNESRPMQIPCPEAKVSKQTRTVMYVAITLFAVNYVSRFFSFSFLRVFDAQLLFDYAGDQDHRYFEALAWTEFAFITGALQIIGIVLFLLIVAREFMKFVNGKPNSLNGALRFSIMAVTIFAGLFIILFALIPTGQEGLSGTRAAGVSMGLFMGIITMITSVIFAMVFPWILETRKADLAFRQTILT